MEGADVRMADRCKANVQSGLGFGRYHQCRFNAVADGFCRRHHPDSVKAREEKRAAIFDARVKQRARPFERAAELSDGLGKALDLLRESQISIGGDWRERRDAFIIEAQTTLEK